MLLWLWLKEYLSSEKTNLKGSGFEGVLGFACAGVSRVVVSAAGAAVRGVLLLLLLPMALLLEFSGVSMYSRKFEGKSGQSPFKSLEKSKTSSSRYDDSLPSVEEDGVSLFFALPFSSSYFRQSMLSKLI